MITKFQQGGQSNQQQVIQAIIQSIEQAPEQTVDALMKKGMNPQQLMQIIQQLYQGQAISPENAKRASARLQQYAQSAAKGAKLQYISSLKNKCKEGEELVYMKAGGRVCPVCREKPVQAEKCGGAVKEFKAKYDKCGGKMKKKAKGGQMDKVTPNDTIHINGKPRALVNVDGPTTKKYPALTNKEYQTLRQQSKKGDKEATRKLNKQNAIQH